MTQRCRSCRLPTVSEDVARDALLRFVASKWTYSSKPARELTFKELRSITVYRVGAREGEAPVAQLTSSRRDMSHEGEAAESVPSSA